MSFQKMNEYKLFLSPASGLLLQDFIDGTSKGPYVTCPEAQQVRGCTWPRGDKWAWAAHSEEARLRNDTVRGFVPFGLFLLIFLFVLFLPTFEVKS